MIYREALSEGQVGLLPGLGRFTSQENLYLGGGTAVALQIGHRLSVDFDFFAVGGLADPLALAARAQAEGIVLQQVQVSRGTLHAVSSGVRLSFLEYTYPLVGALVRWDDFSLDMASLDDLGCMKLAAVAQRGARKDFLDIYALCLKHAPLARLLELYKAKYAATDIAHVLVGLSYFDDAESEPMPSMIWDVSWDDVKRSINAWVSQVVI